MSILILLCGLVSGLWFVIGIGISMAKKDAIDRGFAEYDSKTGEWKWKEKERG